MQKRDVAMFAYMSIFSLCLVFCVLFLLQWNNDLVASVADVIVHVFARLNLMDYQAHIGGHHAQLHWFVWFVNVLFAFAYAVAVSYLVSKKMKMQRKSFASKIFISLISFVLYSAITFSFLFELERFAYRFFVPQV